MSKDKMSDSELVSRIADSLIGSIDAPGAEPSSDEMRLFFDVYCFDMEIGSGASFDQYFHWASKEQIDRIVSQLNELGLDSIIEPTKKAIDVAFPAGVPENEDEFDECLEWTEDQELELEELYEQEVEIHALLEEKLAKYARKNNLLSQI